MKAKEIIEQIRVYQSMSNMDLLDIIEEISGCEFMPMNSPEHVIVFDSVEMNEAWFIALKTIGTKVEEVEITRRPSARWEVRRRRIAYPGYWINDKMVISYIDDDDREYAFGLSIKD